MTWRTPYFDLRSGLFVPCVVTWDAETGEFSRVEGAEAVIQKRYDASVV